ncbi:MAG TPA: hypothetical protein ENJ60_07720 [Aeromonadales bacterium]|nr:hypothetical protein [Aeromonadales bacterium]
MSETLAEEKLNIVGMVVNTSSKEQPRVEGALSEIQGVELHGAEKGKIVITVDEKDCNQPLIDTITELNNITGVIATSIAYHHFDGELPGQEKRV